MKWNKQLFGRSIREFGSFMAPLASVLGRSERRVAATRYVHGLLDLTPKKWTGSRVSLAAKQRVKKGKT